MSQRDETSKDEGSETTELGIAMQTAGIGRSMTGVFASIGSLFERNLR